MNEAAPQYKLTYEQRRGYLYAHISVDTINSEMAILYLREVVDRCNELDYKRLMIDRDIPVVLPDGVMFFVAVQFQEMIKGIRTALINPYSSNDPGLDFGGMVVRNRGGDYALFHNATDAEAWLFSL